MEKNSVIIAGAFLNEQLADGVMLLDFPTLGDYARDDHRFQQQACMHACMNQNIQHIAQDQELHINFIFSDKSAFDAVRFRYFYADCQRITGDITEFDTLTEHEQQETFEFLDKHFSRFPPLTSIWTR